MKDELYPLKFEPILKEKIWGGNKLNTILNKKSNTPKVGESWEISDVEGDTSIVINGNFKGTSLKTLLENHKSDLIGEKNYRNFGNKFPLLIKFIDAKQDLSIQLHPNDELAAKRHNSFGKTEMWYVMQADENANLIVGFNQKMNVDIYLKNLKAKTLPDILNYVKVSEGDSYFIDVGRIHAIGAGVLLAEIQQTSDITYRIHDWDRVDVEGETRELHNDLAIDAIDFEMEDDFRIDYSTKLNTPNKIVSCPYFTTNFIEVSSTIDKVNNQDSFFIYICVDGAVEFVSNSFSERISKGETLLIPAAIKSYQIRSKKAKLLEVYV
ncbi:mannose-6-phosphate isomerase [Flavobacteriales bacterium 34_180_T64]|nr:mannose-6-phosphate isomerase [Flavobacteriales bacterium 34_180_T64]